MILVSPAIVNNGTHTKTIRCPTCKTGRLCDAVTYNNVIKNAFSPDWNLDTVLTLKCPHCKELINIAIIEIQY